MRKGMHFHSLRERKEGGFLVQPSPVVLKRWQALGTVRKYF